GPVTYSGLSADIITDGGAGDDTITVLYSVSNLDYSTVTFYNDPQVNVFVIDLDGDNTVLVGTDHYVYDTLPISNIDILLGSGNDNVSASSSAYANNYFGISSYDIDAGDGDNTVNVVDRSGYADVNLSSGSGNDLVSLQFSVDEGNDSYTDTNVVVSLGNGNDTLSLNVFGVYADYTDVDVWIDLGDGNNSASITLDDADHKSIIISCGTGDDTISISALAADYYGWMPSPYQGVLIDAGDGSNIVDVAIASIYDPLNSPTNDPVPFAHIITGSGGDRINVFGGAFNVISSGAGNDTISAGSGTDTVTMGMGSDSLTVDRSIFSSFSSGTQRLVVTDFSLTDGDKAVLSNWNLPSLGGTGVVDDAGDLQALKTAGGDVLSFVQVGSDALLTLNLGNGELGEILFQNLDISAPPPPPPPTDPKMNLAGTYGNDTLTGGNNDDIIFLRRGRDVATGGDGADVFRFNAVNSHNANGDHHVITDLDFLEGDELRFQNFGPSWAD